MVSDGYLDDSRPIMRSTTAASSPALCKKWQYSKVPNGGPPYEFGDITVTVKKM